MRKLGIIVISKKSALLNILIILLFSILLSICLHPRDLPVNISFYSYSPVIVIDAGHGGIDGGAAVGNVLEKDINLDITKKLKTYLEQKGYIVILTREEDISLDNLSSSGGSRHQRDLNARVNILNNSNAQLFLSIHTNCNLKNPKADGSIIYYNDKFSQNKDLAYCIQRSLNNMIVIDKKRTIHDPQKADYFILSNSKISGVIVETAFLSNGEEQELLIKDEFRDEVAKAIAKGINKYFGE